MSQPGSPDVMEELEDEVLKMMEEEAGDGAAAEPDGANADNFDGEKEVPLGEDLDPEVANALEEELFGAAADDLEEDALRAALGESEDDVDISETELFGPEGEETSATATAPRSQKQANSPIATREAFRGQAPGSSQKHTPGSSQKQSPGSSEKQSQHSHEPDGISNEDREARRENDEGPYDSKTSRFMKDASGNLLHKWKADYAPKGGGGRAQCRDKDCLERFDQGGVLSIEKGCLRIGRRVLMEQDRDGSGGHISYMWHHARCIFNAFLRARKATRIIESEFDIEGLASLQHEDQETIRKLIAGVEKPSTARFNTGEGIPNATPAKRANDSVPHLEMPTAEKKRKMEPNYAGIESGARVWTFFRCLPKDVPGAAALPPGVAGVAVKSEKPELAMIREEPTAGNIIVQFESEEHEKERVELFQSGKGKRIRGWLRYPRLFEGRKQRVPVTWLQMKRNPPALCGCKVQAWGHECPCGISCGRGRMVKVWGVGDTGA